LILLSKVSNYIDIIYFSFSIFAFYEMQSMIDKVKRNEKELEKEK
jgi:hypothetical protein